MSEYLRMEFKVSFKGGVYTTVLINDSFSERVKAEAEKLLPERAVESIQLVSIRGWEREGGGR